MKEVDETMYEDVYEKLQKKNKILFSRDSACLQPLLRLIEKQNHRILVLWSFHSVKLLLEIFEKSHPEETRPRTAYHLCKKWASGEVKMNIAKRAILDCHAVCKELDNPYEIAICHAIGQGLSTVHVETHAIGLPIYELTGIVRKYPTNFEKYVTARIKEYEEALYHIEHDINLNQYDWASFLLHDDIKNKEKQLHEKRR